MNLGGLLVLVAFAAALASTLAYAPALRGRKPHAAGPLFTLHALALLGAAAFLWRLFLSHRFEYAYVAQYSSRALSPELALAASWAGQEGSLLLWSALGGVLGLALLRQPGTLARPAMFFVALMQSFLVWMVVIRTPFATTAVAPADGAGLNPLLADPWMVVHPPVLFVGYAAMVIPFALAAAALVRKAFGDFGRMVWPWALFAVVTLGTGIALGGIWAYRTLGWGGFWGWDPVENASLIPWLVAVALLHGLLIQRATGAAARTNLLLALLGWGTVLGGTYLTRSGVLQNFSVHSFADSGLSAPLSAFLLASVGIGAALLAWRWRAIDSRTANWLSLARESALWLGLATVLVLATLVGFGTMAPLLTGLAGKPASVQPSFYTLVGVPLGIAIILLMGFAPVLRWARQEGLSWLRALAPALVVSVLSTAVAALAGMRDAGHLALVATSGLALAMNAVMTLRLFRRGWAYGAGYLAHAGIAVMMLGMVLSASFGRTQRLQLAQGEPAPALGYTLTYQGERIETGGQRVLSIRLERPGFAIDAHPRLLRSPQGDGDIRKPAMARHGELYLSPIEVEEQARPSEPVWLAKGQESVIGGTGYTFAGFRMEPGAELTVVADVMVRAGDQVTHATPALRVSAGGRHAQDADLGGGRMLSLAAIDADHGRVAVLLPASQARAVALVDLSTKPLINMVWLGALIVVLGSILAGVRRAGEHTPRVRTAARGPLPGPEPAEPAPALLNS
jgi:cytochrome c-type biogenesis protein CcmF